MEVLHADDEVALLSLHLPSYITPLTYPTPTPARLPQLLCLNTTFVAETAFTVERHRLIPTGTDNRIKVLGNVSALSGTMSTSGLSFIEGFCSLKINECMKN